MSMLNSFLLVILVASATACGQNKTTPSPLGTVNGKPIPARVFNVTRIQAINALRRDGKLAPDETPDESTIAAKIQDERCGRLRGAVASEAKAQAIIDFKIVPNRQDLDEALRHLHVGDPAKETAALRERTAVIVSALSAVYDKGMAPDDVYRQMLANHGISEESWKSSVRAGSTAGGRAAIARPLTVTPQIYSEAIPGIQRSLAVSMKLNATINETIADADPVFRAYLARWKSTARTISGDTGHNMGVGDMEYMQRKRAAWWDVRVSKLQVVLSDPSLATTCQLARTTGAVAVDGLQ
jgi:hypothetical protein